MSLDKWCGIEEELITTGSAKECIHKLSNYELKENTPLFTFFSNPKSEGFTVFGGRIYHEELGSHLEITTPECRNPLELVYYNKVLDNVGFIASRTSGQEIYKLSSSYKDEESYVNSLYWGCNEEMERNENTEESIFSTRGSHESYCMNREDFNSKLITNFLCLRPPLIGSGGYDENLEYVIMPRAFFAKKDYDGAARTHPILSARDEPLSTHKHYRVHVTSGEPLKSEVANLVRTGFTNYVIKCIEEDIITVQNTPIIKKPLTVFKELSTSLCNDLLIRTNKGNVKYTDLLYFYLNKVEELFENKNPNPEHNTTLRWIIYVVNNLFSSKTDDVLEWKIKKRAVSYVLDNFDLSGMGVDEAKLQVVTDFGSLGCDDLYDLLLDDSFFRIRTILDSDRIGECMLSPPPDSRAVLRNRIAEKYYKNINEITWNKIILYYKNNPFIENINELDGWNDKRINYELKLVGNKLKILKNKKEYKKKPKKFGRSDEQIIAGLRRYTG